MTARELLHVHGLGIHTHGGRRLLRDLTLILDRGDRVAVIGRNGVGKSSLLGVLAGENPPDAGHISRHGVFHLVPQHVRDLPGARSKSSPGDLRRARLQHAFALQPDLLLLDEPTLDLDETSTTWLLGALHQFRRGLMVVSHEPRLLRQFEDFFVVTEAGCHHVHGDFEALLDALERNQELREQQYVKNLAQLAALERQRDRVQRRALRKKNVGRIRELDRRSARAVLNTKRGHAQESQEKRRWVQDQRAEVARCWVAATRRALAVTLPLEAALPRLGESAPSAIVKLSGVSVERGERLLFDGLSLSVRRERLAVTGANGAGKTTLLELLVGQRRPDRGRVTIDLGRIGYVAQHAANWDLPESTLQCLVGQTQTSVEQAAAVIRAHKFPFALAERPLRSLSPGERLRAALICVLQRPTPPELLVLDEPTNHLDFLGYRALQRLLSTWSGGLVVVSHDRSFLAQLSITEWLALSPHARGPTRSDVASATGGAHSVGDGAPSGGAAAAVRRR